MTPNCSIRSSSALTLGIRGSATLLGVICANGVASSRSFTWYFPFMVPNPWNKCAYLSNSFRCGSSTVFMWETRLRAPIASHQSCLEASNHKNLLLRFSHFISAVARELATDVKGLSAWASQRFGSRLQGDTLQLLECGFGDNTDVGSSVYFKFHW